MTMTMPWLKVMVLLCTFITLHSYAQPPIPDVSGDNVVCYGDTAILTASVNPSDSTLTYRWYDDFIGGAPLFVGNPFHLGPVTSTRTIYCESVDTLGNTSLIRAPFVVLEILNVDVPSATLSPASLCPGDTVTLTGISIIGGASYNWYEDALDVTPIFQGNPFVTSHSTSTNFYIESVNSFGCRSIRTPVHVPVFPNGDIPFANANPNGVCPGDSILLTSGSLNGSTVFNWYDAPFAGNKLATNDSLWVTPDSSELFYVASESTYGCESIRTPVLAVVTPNLDIPVGLPSKLIACPDDTITLTGTSLNGSSTFKWYDDPAIDGNLLYTGQIWTTTIASTTTYWLETEDANGCPSGRTGVLVTVIPNIDIPFSTVDPVAFCPGDTITVTGTSINGSTTFDWYDHPVSGSLLHTGNPYVTSTTDAETYWLSTRNSAGCKSIRTPIAVTPIPNIDVPLGTATPLTACPSDSVTFTANSLAGYSDFRWYDSPLGGSLLFEGNPFETTSASTLTVYVESVSDIGCGSIRTPIVAVVLPNLDVPVAVATPFEVCPGDTVIFNGISPAGYNNFFWYDAQSGGNLIATGSNYITPIDTSTTLFLETQNANGCESIRTSAVVLVNRNLDIPVATASKYIACLGDSVTLFAGSGNNSIAYNWYRVPIGGNSIGSGTPFETTVDTTVTFWVESIDSNGCPSLRSPVTIVVYPNHDIPLANANPLAVCEGDSIQLTGQSINGSTIFNWYDTLLSNQPIHVGQSFYVTPTQANTYFLETENQQGCKSLRTPITALVNRNTDVPEAYANPLVICEGDSSLLTGASLQLHAVFHWYDSSSNGNLILDGVNHYVSPNVTTTYYVETVDDDGCSSVRTPVIVTVSENNDSLVVSSNTSAVCDSGAITLTVSSTNGSQNFTWYNESNGQNEIGYGSTLTVNVTSDSTFYVESVNQNGCQSTEARDSISVGVISNTDSLSVTVDASAICPGDPVQLTASSNNGSIDFTWYDAAQNGNIVGQGPTISPTVNITSVFYVESIDTSGCASPKGNDTVFVNFNADQPTISSTVDSVCKGTQVTFSGNSPSGYDLYWYDAPNGGNLLYIGNTYQFAANQDRTVFIESINGTGCESNRDSASIFVRIAPGLSAVSNDSSVCPGNTVSLYAIPSSSTATIKWYDAQFGGNLLATGENYLSQPLFANELFWVEVESSNGCQGGRTAISIVVLDNGNIDIPAIDCSNPKEREILFTWTAVQYAGEYQITFNYGDTWISTDLDTFYLVSNLSSEQEVTIQVRAIPDPSYGCLAGQVFDSDYVTCTSDEIDGELLPGSDIVIPYNSFSPNNDGVNDHWNIGADITAYKDNQVQIFNRIGEPVFSTVGYDNVSNFFTGEGLADGTYYYVVNIPSIDFSTSGYLMLSR